MTQIERVQLKAWEIYELIKDFMETLECRHENETLCYPYILPYKYRLGLEFYDRPTELRDGKLVIVMGYADYSSLVKKGRMGLNLHYFKNPDISVKEKLRVIRHELGHIREMRLHGDRSEEAAKKYEVGGYYGYEEDKRVS